VIIYGKKIPPSILFIDSGKNNNANVVNKINLILADDYSKFTVGSSRKIQRSSGACNVRERGERERKATIYSPEIIQPP